MEHDKLTQRQANISQFYGEDMADEVDGIKHDLIMVEAQEIEDALDKLKKRVRIGHSECCLHCPSFYEYMLNILTTSAFF